MREYRNSYKNAYEVLPEELIRKLQSIYTGPVWIPAVKKRRIKTEAQERDRRILEMHTQGRSIKEIAEAVFLCEERVRQIIKQKRGKDGR